MYEIENGALNIVFGADDSGLPEKISLTEPDGQKYVLIRPGAYTFELELYNGEILRPSGGKCMKFVREDVLHIEFHQVKWRAQSQPPVPGLLSSFCYELHPDGTMFTNGFFTAMGSTPPGVRRFELTIRPEFKPGSPLKWASFGRPAVADGTLIQTAAPERFLDRGQTRIFGDGIMPMVSFQTLDHGAPQLYTEFFVEGGNTLSGIPEDNESSVSWENGNPVIKWNFQKNLRQHHHLPWQWRNHWGLIIKNAPVKRHLPPLVMYHYFDNFMHYPDDECLNAMARCGCQVLAMHENWRLDVQDGGIPFDGDKFRKLVADAHRHNIRVAPYIRGNENSVEEDSARWFCNYLKANFDGLYMDYGGPFHIISPPDECYQNGRIHFRRHYMKLRELRNTVGVDGVFYAHTGPLFSALGLNFTDGYVSGEGERGILLKGRLEHEYFSMASVAPGTLWTAAFPEYGTPAIVPSMAAAGQYPHSTLGIQMKSSSLAHPPVPGINDLPYRMLWKLWRTFKDERDMAIFNDFNCRDVFAVDDPDFIGHNLLVAGDKELLVISNFAPDKRKVRIGTSFLKGKSGAVLLLNGKAVVYKDQEIELDGFGVAGIITGAAPETLEEYCREYPELSPSGIRSLEAVAEQRRLRENPVSWTNMAIDIRLPESAGAPYEESLIHDLYASEVFLYEISEDGGKTLVRELGALAPGRDHCILNLAEFLSPGTHKLALQSLYHGQPFYSLAEVRLFNADNPEEGYTVEFNNALDADRSILTWQIKIS